MIQKYLLQILFSVTVWLVSVFIGVYLKNWLYLEMFERFLHAKTKENMERFQKMNNNENSLTLIPKIVKPLCGAVSDKYNNVFKDVDLFESVDQNTVFNVFSSKSHLQGSKTLGKNIMERPEHDVSILNDRLIAMKFLEDKITNAPLEIDEHFKSLSDNENNALWLFEEREEHVDDLMNIVFLKFPCVEGFNDKVNSNPYATTFINFYKILLSPVIGILSPIIYIVIPFLILKWKVKIPISFVQYVKMFLLASFNTTSSLKFISAVSYAFSAIFYFQGLFNSFTVSKTVKQIASYIVDKFSGAVSFLQSTKAILEYFWSDTYMYFLCEKLECKPMDAFDKLTKNKFGLFRVFGNQLCQYKNIDKTIVNNVLQRIYLLDFLRSCILIKRDREYCFPSFVNEKMVHLEGVKHPCLDVQKVVPNDFTYTKNVIVTGPNAGGKSTFIKCILINTILCQTICISPSSLCNICPFKEIISQINIPDCKGKESLFEAEMYRCSNTLNRLKDNTDTPIMVIMDEIFNSTNPVEGIAGALAICKKMGSYENAIVIFTTHYVYLTKLSKLTNTFINMKMNVIQSQDDIQFPYKIDFGVSKQYIALELLKKNSFDKEIIDDAIALKTKLTS